MPTSARGIGEAHVVAMFQCRESKEGTTTLQGGCMPESTLLMFPSPCLASSPLFAMQPVQILGRHIWYQLPWRARLCPLTKSADEDAAIWQRGYTETTEAQRPKRSSRLESGQGSRLGTPNTFA